MKTTWIATVLALPVFAVSAVTVTAELSDGSLPTAASSLREHTIPGCMVLLDSKVDVPAQEAGVLTQVLVKEGEEVQAGDQLAQIDDEQARLQLAAAASQHAGAELTANSTVRIKYAIAQERMNEQEYLKIQDANREKPGTYPRSEEMRAEFQWKSAEFQIENAEEEKQVAAYDASVKGTEKAAAKASIERRRLTSEINGRLEEIRKMPGEWVQPGDIVMQVVNLEKLRVDAHIREAAFHPNEMRGQEVKVTAKIADRGTTREVEFDGRIVFVSSSVVGGIYRVRAEVINRRSNSGWILYPGMEVDMTVLFAQ